jgi:hypothetical protein
MQITLGRILESLSYETLSFMAESNHANGSIAADQIPKVVGRVNAVLRRLAVKFVLRERRIKVNVTLDRRYYTLNVDDAWIEEDPDETFTGDVGRILAIETPTGRNHDLGDKATLRTIVLRDEGKAFALDTTLEAGVYTVIYKAATPQFVFDVADTDLEQVLHIPEPLLNALYLGVAAITYENIGGAENVSMAQSKWSQYEKECAEARINSAIEIEENDEGNKFLDRGFH